MKIVFHNTPSNVYRDPIFYQRPLEDFDFINIPYELNYVVAIINEGVDNFPHDVYGNFFSGQFFGSIRTDPASRFMTINGGLKDDAKYKFAYFEITPSKLIADKFVKRYDKDPGKGFYAASCFPDKSNTALKVYEKYNAIYLAAYNSGFPRIGTADNNYPTINAAQSSYEKEKYRHTNITKLNLLDHPVIYDPYEIKAYMAAILGANRNREYLDLNVWKNSVVGEKQKKVVAFYALEYFFILTKINIDNKRYYNWIDQKLIPLPSVDAIHYFLTISNNGRRRQTYKEIMSKRHLQDDLIPPYKPEPKSTDKVSKSDPSIP